MCCGVVVVLAQSLQRCTYHRRRLPESLPAHALTTQPQLKDVSLVAAHGRNVSETAWQFHCNLLVNWNGVTIKQHLAVRMRATNHVAKQEHLSTRFSFPLRSKKRR